MTVAALLLGRKGSTGLPGKNSRPVLGRPMVAYPLMAARPAIHVDRIYVSTDDPEIAAIGVEHDAEVIDRPPELCTPEALGEDAYKHGHEVIRDRLAAIGEEVEMLPLLFANAPTVSGQLIDRGVEVLRADPTIDSAVTVSRYNMWSPLRARRLTDQRHARAVCPVRDVRRSSDPELRPRQPGRRVVCGYGPVGGPPALPRRDGGRAAAAALDGPPDRADRVLGRLRRRLRVADARASSIWLRAHGYAHADTQEPVA